MRPPASFFLFLACAAAKCGVRAVAAFAHIIGAAAPRQCVQKVQASAQRVAQSRGEEVNVNSPSLFLSCRVRMP